MKPEQAAEKWDLLEQALQNDPGVWAEATPEAQHRLEDLQAEIEAERAQFRTRTLACWEEHLPLETLGREVRCMLLLATLSTWRTRLSPSLLESLVRFGLWKPEEAVTYLRQWNDGASETEALEKLAPYLTTELLPQAWQSALRYPNIHPFSPMRPLLSLAPYLPAEMLPQAWDYIRMRMSGLYVRPECVPILLAFAPRLPQYLQLSIFENALDMGWIAQEALAVLAPLLISEDRQKLWEEMQSRSENLHDPHLLIALAPYLPIEWLPQALKRAQSLSDRWNRAHAVLAVALRLPPEQKASLLQQVLTEAQREEALPLLIALLPHLPEEQREALLQHTLDMVLRLPTWEASYELPKIASYLSVAQAEQIWLHVQALEETEERARLIEAYAAYWPMELLPKVWESIRNVEDRCYYPWAQCALIPYLPDALRAQAWEDLQGREEEWKWVQMLKAFTPELSLSQIEEALERAQRLNREGRIEALVALAPHLPSARRDALLRNADAVLERFYPLPANRNLETFAGYLPSELYATVLESIWKGTNSWDRGSLLEALAPYLTPALLQQAWAKALALPEDEERENTLISLLRFMPAEAQQALWDSVGDLQEEWSRYKLLSGLAAHLSADQLAQALEMADGMKDAYARSITLTRLSEYLPPETRTQVLHRVLDILPEIEEIAQQLDGLLFLIRTLSPESPLPLRQRALDAALAIEREDQRGDALQALARCLSEEQMEQAIDAVQRFQSEQAWIETIAVLLPLLPPVRRDEKLEEVLDIVWANEDIEFVSYGLVLLAPLLYPEMLKVALEIPRNETDRWCEDPQMHALRTLAPYLPAELLPQALEQAERISSPSAHGALAERLSPDARDREWEKILIRIDALTDDASRGYALAEVIPSMPPTWLPPTLERVRNLPDKQPRRDALIALADRVTDEQFPFCLQLLDAAARENYTTALDVLTSLAPLLQKWGGDETMIEIARTLAEGVYVWE